MKKTYTVEMLENAMKDFNTLALKDYTTARDAEKDVISMCNHVNGSNKRQALESVETVATLSNVFSVKLPVYDEIKVSLKKDATTKNYSMTKEENEKTVPIEEAYSKLRNKEKGYNPVNWIHIGYSLISLINVEYEQNDIHDFKPSTIGQLKEQLSFFGNCSSKIIRSMCELLKPTFKKDGTIMYVSIKEEQVIKAYAKALEMNSMTKKYETYTNTKKKA